MAQELARTIAGFTFRDLTEREWIMFKVHLAGIPAHADDKRMALQEAADYTGRRLNQKDYIETGVLRIAPVEAEAGP